MPETFANVNALWSAVLVRTWQRLGLRHAVVSPGSRSTPLTVSLVRNPGIRAIPILDERSAAFFALGLARQTRRPVLLVCTSGSAGAHYLPAVIEARLAGIPLLVVTADRPPEMRNCSSGQTIDQQNLYGVHAASFTELPVPSSDPGELARLAGTAAAAWAAATAGFPSPVHLNQPFRDPLAPDVSDGNVPHSWPELPEPRPLAPPLVPDIGLLENGTRQAAGLIVAGPGLDAHPGWAAALAALAEATGWPVLADTLSGLRSRSAPEVWPKLLPRLVTTYDLIARHHSLRAELTPSVVVQFGPWPTSKTLRAWLGEARPQVVSIWDGPESADCLHLPGCRIGSPAGLSAAFASLTKLPAAAAGWAGRWTRAELSARQHLSAALAEAPMETEPLIAPALHAALTSRHMLFFANSMAARDAEWFCSPRGNGPRIAHHRGANGIDGLVSAALGRAAETGEHVVLLCGDLAFLHDSNALLSRRHLRGSLTVVVVNNRGGGIFESLPVAHLGSVFEEFFATPQQVDLPQLCHAHSIPHRLAESAREVVGNLETGPGLRVIEVRTDRARDMAWRKAVFASFASA